MPVYGRYRPDYVPSEPDWLENWRSDGGNRGHALICTSAFQHELSTLAGPLTTNMQKRAKSGKMTYIEMYSVGQGVRQ
jgi:hypothetical protein